MLHQSITILSVLALPFVGGAGYLAGQENARVEIVQASEKDAAMILHGQNARLIGFFCNNHNATVIAYEEDEFPDGCKEIRALKEVEGS